MKKKHKYLLMLALLGLLIAGAVVGGRMLLEKENRNNRGAKVMANGTYLQKGRAYMAKVAYDEESRQWIPLTNPESIPGHVVSFEWKNLSDYQTLRNPRNGTRKTFIFRVMGKQNEYEKVTLKSGDMGWKDLIICAILEIR